MSGKIKKKFKCKQCGRCCIVWFNNDCCVTLTDKEIESKKYLIRARSVSYGDLVVLRKKTVYIPVIGRKVSCCVYLDIKTMKCKIIPEDKFWVCKRYSCDGAQEVVKWALLKSGEPYRFFIGRGD